MTMLTKFVTFGDEFKREKDAQITASAFNSTTEPNTVFPVVHNVDVIFDKDRTPIVTLTPKYMDVIESLIEKKNIKPTREEAREILEKKIHISQTHSTLWLMWDVTQESRRQDAIKTILEMLDDFGFLRSE